MKKTVSLMLTAVFAVQFLMAQIPAGIKFLNYDKYNSAKEAFQKAYDANPKDPQAIYWLGQGLLAADNSDPSKEQIAAAEALYKKGLNEVGSDPWLLVGMGHVEILQKGDLNSAKQKFEQAITASTETKGKNKGKPNADILNAIGRANAYVSGNLGDHAYAIDKLKQAAAIDLTNPDIYINMGINYLKMGGENGGEAVKAYQEAIRIDPKNARAYYRMGKIYQSQNNKELYDQYFQGAITADPTFPPVYYAYYDLFKNKDVNEAKSYLDKYIANADKDPMNDLFQANYLFLSGKYAESLALAKQLEASGGAKGMPKLDVLYAYNYDRLGDSIQAKSYLTKYFANAKLETIIPADYELAVKVFSKFPGSEDEAIGYINKAIANDTSKANKIQYMAQAADLYGKAKKFPQQMEWTNKMVALRGTPLSEYEFFNLTNAALTAKDYPSTIDLAKKYMAAFPDKQQPYSFFKKAAAASDPDTTTGLRVEYYNYLDSVYTVVDKEKYKKEIFVNQYYILNFYLKKMIALKNSPDFKITTAGTKTPTVDEYIAVAKQAVAVTDSMLASYPNPGDENKFAMDTKADIQKRIDYYSNPPAAAPKKTTGGGAAGAGGKG
ncbi:tetratricopeptide repeat protein [Sediminibacterium roseum]|uniref:Tetratricopeptide repeat protein n=1 Tax=Sediminibacterium roseum TaxID=1978412 RepID=A0ABW9ZZD5_9BACT|nr:tetratricopeptide repeat protein [Sediminibacterium roseum]NCI51682.1 tetratricopeptide repeat protein [Sediminibacterium roseum]